MPKKRIMHNDGFETVHTGGFAPSWKPENKGEYILITPTSVIRKLPKQRKVKKEGNILECTYRGGNSDNFYAGDTQVEVKEGATIGLILSFNLMAETALAVEDGKIIRLSKMSRVAINQNGMLKIVYEGKMKLRGGRSMHQIIVQAPKGYKDLVNKMSDISISKKNKT